jgi:hypothetical protein
MTCESGALRTTECTFARFAEVCGVSNQEIYPFSLITLKILERVRGNPGFNLNLEGIGSREAETVLSSHVRAIIF